MIIGGNYKLLFRFSWPNIFFTNKWHTNEQKNSCCLIFFFIPYHLIYNSAHFFLLTMNKSLTDRLWHVCYNQQNAMSRGEPLIQKNLKHTTSNDTNYFFFCFYLLLKQKKLVIEQKEWKLLLIHRKDCAWFCLYFNVYSHHHHKLHILRQICEGIDIIIVLWQLCELINTTLSLVIEKYH